jgi:hypothetical protein
MLFSTVSSAAIRFHCVGGCWDRIQDCCDFAIDSQTLYLIHYFFLYSFLADYSVLASPVLMSLIFIFGRCLEKARKLNLENFLYLHVFFVKFSFNENVGTDTGKYANFRRKVLKIFSSQ